MTTRIWPLGNLPEGSNMAFWPLIFWKGIISGRGQLILSKVIKTAATSCQNLRLKCIKFDFSWGSAPDPAGGAYSAPPDPVAGYKGLLEMWPSWFWPPSPKIVPVHLLACLTGVKVGCVHLCRVAGNIVCYHMACDILQLWNDLFMRAILFKC